MEKIDLAQLAAEQSVEISNLKRELEKYKEKENHKLRKALSVTDILNMKKETLPFEDEWAEAFGQPERYGVWFIWGRSGSGKTSFVLKLCKELTKYGKVAYDSLEEGDCLTMQNALVRVGMAEVNRRFVLLPNESMEDLQVRLDKRRSADFVVIDSFQYTKMGWNEYVSFKERYPKKLIIFVSQADGNKPNGRTGVSVMYDASLKIWVEGYRAFSKGRFFGNKGYFDVWKERAEKYHGN